MTHKVPFTAAVLAAAFCLILGAAMRHAAGSRPLDREQWPQDATGWQW